MATADRVRELILPLLDDMDLELDHIEYTGGLLRVTVDHPGGGVDLETLTNASDRVSRLLDEHDPVPGRYTLEVSSPGLERPLRTPLHYRRFVGTKVNVKTHAHVEGERRVEGILEDADETGFTVAGRRLSYDDVERARTVFEWGGQPKPGTKPGATKAASAPKKQKKKAQTVKKDEGEATS